MESSTIHGTGISQFTMSMCGHKKIRRSKIHVNQGYLEVVHKMEKNRTEL